MFGPFFSSSYVQARDRFLSVARQSNAVVTSHVHPTATGVEGEALSMDTAYLGTPDAPSLLVLTSAMHGAEGYCGSGCQVALMKDTLLLDKARAGGIGILLIHAVNPYGFSWNQRGNEDNIDLNRNFCDYSRPLRENRHYDALHPFLVPASWPPSPQNEAGVQDFIRREGEQAYREGMMMGQHKHANGLFYGGREPAWSNRTLREILNRHGQGRERMAWIDYHTGLGPYGHAEKIFVQAGKPEYERARAWWGADVMAVSDPDSSTVDIAGTGMQAMLEECSQVPQLTFLALEYGTVPMADVFLALRSDRWLAQHPEADGAQQRALKAAHRAAFYPDHDDWRGAVIGQSRCALLQAIYGLSANQVPMEGGSDPSKGNGG